MKRIMLSFLLICFLGLYGCGNDVAAQQFNDLNNSYEELEKRVAALEVQSGVQTVDPDVSDPDSSNDEKPKSPRTDSEIEMYADDFVTIWYSHCEAAEFENMGNVIIFSAENKTEVPISVVSNSVSADGVSLSDTGGFQEIAPQSKGKLRLYSFELPTLEPSTITGSFQIQDDTETLWGNSYYDVTLNKITVK